MRRQGAADWQHGDVDLDLAVLRPLAGGWSGHTFVAEGGQGPVVVRVYPPGAREVGAPETDAAVMRLVRGLVPVPEVLEVRRGDAAADVPGLLITGWCEGHRGDEALAAFDDAQRERMGAEMGRLAATLAGMPTLHSGTFTADLHVTPWALDLARWIEDHRPRMAGWSDDELESLVRVGERAQAMLDEVGRTSVVHSDLNPKNVLVDDRGNVVALLDWEFAHSGSPFTDLGNVLRFDRDPGYVAAALESYAAQRGGEPAEILDLARAADLPALVGLASKQGQNPVADASAALLRAIARSGDLHAWPRRC